MYSELQCRSMGEIIKSQSQSTNDESDMDEIKRPCLVDYAKAPKFTKDNKYLLRGYRCNYDTPSKALGSIFHWHNETCNIWTHFIPFIFTLIAFIYISLYDEPPLIFYFIQDGSQLKNQVSTSSIKFTLITSIYLFGASSMYHTMFCVNEKFSRFLLRLDYSGVCVISVGAIIPILHYGYYCEPDLMYFYIFLTLIVSLSVCIISLMDFMHEESFVMNKTLIYIILFIINLFPVFQIIVFNKGQLDFLDAETWLLLAIINLSMGAFVFSTRFPEVYFPKKFDYIAGSHQIWHLFVISTFLCNYFGILSIFIDRSNNNCEMSQHI